MNRVLKAIIVNVVPLNGGDYAILEAEKQLLRDLSPDIDITILASDTALIKKWNKESNLDNWVEQWNYNSNRHKGLGKYIRLIFWQFKINVLRFVPRALRSWWLGKFAAETYNAIDKADIVFSTGGTYLTGNYDVSSRFLLFKLIKKMGKRLILFPQSINLEGQRFKKQYLRQLSKAETICARDKRSAMYLKDKQLKNISVLPDIAFYLCKGDWPVKPRTHKVLISVRDWPYAKNGQQAQNAYEQAIATFVNKLSTDNIETNFLSTCQGISEYRFDDSIVAKRIVSQLGPANKASIEHGYHTTEEILNHITKYDLIVSTRLHFAILALVLGKPVLPIAYEYKTVEVFKSLGLGEYVLDIESISFEALFDKYIKIKADSEHIQQIVQHSVLKQKDDLYSFFNQYIGENIDLSL